MKRTHFTVSVIALLLVSTSVFASGFSHQKSYNAGEDYGANRRNEIRNEIREDRIRRDSLRDSMGPPPGWSYEQKERYHRERESLDDYYHNNL